MAEPFVVPASTASVLSLETAFSMTGFLLGYATVARTGTPLFALDLIGGGTARFGPLQNIGSVYLNNSGGLRFHFEDQAAVPEPASMLLVGTGAALAALRARRRRRHPRSASAN